MKPWAEPKEQPAGRNPRDHRAWLAHWSASLVKAIADAIANPPAVGQAEDFRLQWAVHCARLAHRRAIKAHPRLKQGLLSD